MPNLLSYKTFVSNVDFSCRLTSTVVRGSVASDDLVSLFIAVKLAHISTSPLPASPIFPFFSTERQAAGPRSPLSPVWLWIEQLYVGMHFILTGRTT